MQPRLQAMNVVRSMASDTLSIPVTDDACKTRERTGCQEGITDERRMRTVAVHTRTRGDITGK